MNVLGWARVGKIQPGSDRVRNFHGPSRVDPGQKDGSNVLYIMKFVDFVTRVGSGHEFSDPTRGLTRVRADPRLFLDYVHNPT